MTLVVWWPLWGVCLLSYVLYQQIQQRRDEAKIGKQESPIESAKKVDAEVVSGTDVPFNDDIEGECRDKANTGDVGECVGYKGTEMMGN